jgi:cysteinyl-tRNA synthetase
MTLQVVNRLTRQKEEFKPLVEGQVKMYVCGPTVYDHPHIGHAKTYVSFDVILRYLRYSGYRVRYVQNITDVGHLLDTGEDRILKRAGALSLEPMEVVETYTHSFFDDMDDLGVVRPDISPRASGHVPEQIAITLDLIEKGNAYATEAGDVYFDISTFAEYGKLSGRRSEEMQGEREIAGSEKRNPGDFALWRHAGDEHLMQWDSPWGRGFPGWHIECTAMATKYLGKTFDIHGGGLENQFPHNECEIAQSEAWTGQPFANYWLLTGSLTIDGVKMSKSLGNFITIKEAIGKVQTDKIKPVRPEVLRTFILMSHYSSPIDFSNEALESAEKGWERLVNAVQLIRHAQANAPDNDAAGGFETVLEEHRRRFTDAMDDDFNSPVAIGVLHDLTREVNSLINSGEEVGRSILEKIDDLYRELGGQVLGIIPDQITAEGADAERLDGVVKLLIDMRAEARNSKNFAQADTIRNRLAEAGIILEDRTDGTIYKLS